MAIYGGIVFLLWVVQWWLSEETLGIGIVKSLLHFLLIPALLLLPICLVMRRRWLVPILLPSFIAFFVSFGILLLPRTRAAPVALPTFRLMTFNIQSPEASDMPALIEIIRAADADVVAMQELTPAAAASFAAQFVELYPHQALHPQPDYSGQGVLSRYPISGDEYWRYQELPGALGHQRVVVRIAERPVVLYNLHPVPPLTYRQYLNAAPHRTAITNLLARIADESAPVLLAGDFNMTDQFHGYRQIRANYTDAFRAVGEMGFGFTFPNKRAVPLPAFLRLDYIFHDAGFVGIRAQVWPSTGPADHAPVLADLALQAATSENR